MDALFLTRKGIGEFKRENTVGWGQLRVENTLKGELCAFIYI